MPKKYMTSGNLMRKMMGKCKAILPPGFGCTILVYPHYDKGIANYISDSERSDMIKHLRSTADRLEKNQDFPTPENN
ncbi:hypothetical protein [Salinimicrobium sp. WS361]|uniref:hypothetical protein n=1 Tax=Salinimicrobium sp. WS361 TaxID=3425123 RepID=UPI003D6FC024